MKRLIIYWKKSTFLSPRYFCASLGALAELGTCRSKAPLDLRSCGRWFGGSREPVWVSLHWNIWWISTFSLAAPRDEWKREGCKKQKKINMRVTCLWSLILPGASDNWLQSLLSTHTWTHSHIWHVIHIIIKWLETNERAWWEWHGKKRLVS